MKKAFLVRLDLYSVLTDMVRSLTISRAYMSNENSKSLVGSTNTLRRKMLILDIHGASDTPECTTYMILGVHYRY